MTTAEPGSCSDVEATNVSHIPAMRSASLESDQSHIECFGGAQTILIKHISLAQSQKIAALHRADTSHVL
jgi:hypothetical protein